jgi:hypothetical protein
MNYEMLLSFLLCGIELRYGKLTATDDLDHTHTHTLSLSLSLFLSLRRYNVNGLTPMRLSTESTLCLLHRQCGSDLADTTRWPSWSLHQRGRSME